VGRGRYTTFGILLVLLKYNLDRFLAAIWFGRSWTIFHYLQPGGGLAIDSLIPGDKVFFAMMVLLAIPFVWVGVVLTVRRLRDLDWPLWVVILFFVPFLNLLFFAMLSVLPGARMGEDPAHAPGDDEGILGWLLPRSRWGSAATAVLLTSSSGMSLLWLSTEFLQRYGWGLFVGLPFIVGLSAVLLFGYRQRRGLGECLGVSFLAILILAGFAFALALEGLICLLIAAPLAGAVGLFGGLIGYGIQRCTPRRDRLPPIITSLFLFTPLLMGAEHVARPEPPLLVVRTSVDIHAPPEKVWRQMVAFEQIPEPTEWLFRLGIAYPVTATIRGEGVGAVRHCVFSTGTFVEPIEVWDEPRLLKFAVTVNPPPMKEWTPYPHIHPAHLDGFLVSEGGQFRLMRLEGGRTRLEGTTWYRHRMWPVAYWRFWSDSIIHQIHGRVLRHIKQQAEAVMAEASPWLHPATGF